MMGKDMMDQWVRDINTGHTGDSTLKFCTTILRMSSAVGVSISMAGPTSPFFEVHMPRVKGVLVTIP
jgi:hypothetical protein